MWQQSFEMYNAQSSPMTTGSLASPNDFNYSRVNSNFMYQDYQVPFTPTDHLQQVPSPTGTADWDLRSPTMFSPLSIENCQMSSGSHFESPGSQQSLKPNSPEGRWFSSSEFDFLHLQQESPNEVKPRNLSDFNQEIQGGFCKAESQQVQVFSNRFYETEKLVEDHISHMESNPMISKAMDDERNEIEVTSRMLNISTNPNDWSVAEAIRWMEWALKLYNVTPNFPLQGWVGEGKMIVTLNQEFFLRAFPSGGDFIFSKLDIWKSYSDCNQTLSNARDSAGSSPSTSYEDMFKSQENQTLYKSGMNHDKNVYPNLTSRPSNIQLWQFVKELLNNPNFSYGTIQWVDQKSGIFKIVDSVRVAKLWGQYKNRPAMNYDKLSRSLRQYYKKGIMKKTSKTPRLIYQFCSPYHL